MSIAFHVHVGERVIVTIDPERRSWANNNAYPADGSEGLVLGFNQFENFATYWQNFGRKPGKYHGNSLALVQVAGREPQYFSSTELKLADPDKQAERWAAWSALSQDERSSYSHGFRVGDLPKTPYWEFDTVACTQYPGETFRIIDIRYHPLPGIINTYICFFVIQQVTKDGVGWQIGAGETELSLVERGNLWKYFNGGKPSFKSLLEEAAFHQGIGNAVEVRNPATKLFKWTKDEALAAVESGIAHGFSAEKGGIIGQLTGRPNDIRISLYKFADEDLGRRIREETLAGFVPDTV